MFTRVRQLFAGVRYLWFTFATVNHNTRFSKRASENPSCTPGPSLYSLPLRQRRHASVIRSLRRTSSACGGPWVWFLPDVIRTEPTVLPKPDPDFPVLPKENVLGNTDNTGETMVNTDAQDPGIVI